MEATVTEKKVKVQKPNSHTSIYIRKDLKKRMMSDLTKINKKDFGHKVRFDEYLALAVNMITQEQLQQLQESSLSNSDRLERDYRDYTSNFGYISKDEYLGKRLSGEIRIDVSLGVGEHKIAD